MDPKDAPAENLADAITRAMSSLSGMAGSQGGKPSPSKEMAAEGSFGEIYSGIHSTFGERKLRYWMYEDFGKRPGSSPKPSVWLKPMSSQRQTGRSKERALPLEPGWLPSLRSDGRRSEHSWILLQLRSVPVSPPTFRKEFNFVKTLPPNLIDEARLRLRRIRRERRSQRKGESPQR